MAMRVLLLLMIAGTAQAAQCVSESGPGTAALVELYTTEGCSSCARAERRLSSLRARAAAGRLVPIALHVDYGDYVGLKRQRKLSPLQRMALVYTPQLVLQGRDFPGWDSRAFDDAVERINAQPARASLRLEIHRADADALDVEVRAILVERDEYAALYLAAYRGRTLNHDYLVLEWQGPFGVTRERVHRRRLPLVPGATPADSGVAAFVQNRRTGAVLQALLRSAC